MSNGLNAFQQRCKHLLEEIVESCGGWFSDLHLENKSNGQHYLQATIQPGEIDVQVDVDMVEYVVGERSYRVEILPSYPEDRLLRDLGEALAGDITMIASGR